MMDSIWLYIASGYLGAGLLTQLFRISAIRRYSEIDLGVADDSGLWSLLPRLLFWWMYWLIFPKILAKGIGVVFGTIGKAIATLFLWLGKAIAVPFLWLGKAWWWIWSSEQKRLIAETKHNQRLLQEISDLRKESQKEGSSSGLKITRRQKTQQLLDVLQATNQELLETKADLQRESLKRLEREMRALDLSGQGDLDRRLENQGVKVELLDQDVDENSGLGKNSGQKQLG